MNYFNNNIEKWSLSQASNRNLITVLLEMKHFVEVKKPWKKLQNPILKINAKYLLVLKTSLRKPKFAVPDEKLMWCQRFVNNKASHPSFY